MSHFTVRLPGSERSILYPWIIVHLVVTLLVSLAWVLASTSADVDYTEGKFSQCDQIKHFSWSVASDITMPYLSRVVDGHEDRISQSGGERKRHCLSSSVR